MVIDLMRDRRMGHCTYCNEKMTSSEIRTGYDDCNEPIHEVCFSIRRNIKANQKNMLKNSFTPIVERTHKERNLDAKIANMTAIIAKETSVGRKKIGEQVFPMLA